MNFFINLWICTFCVHYYLNYRTTVYRQLQFSRQNFSRLFKTKKVSPSSYTIASWSLCNNHWHNTDYQHVNTFICYIITLIGTTANILHLKLTVLTMFHCHDNKYLKFVWQSFQVFMPKIISLITFGFTTIQKISKSIFSLSSTTNALSI